MKTLEKHFIENQHHNENKNYAQIAQELNIPTFELLKFMNESDIEIQYHFYSSFKEEIKNFLQLENVIFDAENIIPNNKLDVYIPDHKLAIEFNGLYSNAHSIDKTKYYHLNKTKLCEEKGILLLHIFENEWIDDNKRDIWKSIINGKINKNQRIFARKCEVKEITNNNKLIKSFLEENHLQGLAGSSVKIGLFCDDELVSLMTFGKTRFSKKYEWEMIRFCNKKFISIVGGASKLYKYFTNNYNPNNIISYSDKRYSNGSLYEKLGFKFSHNSNPNYWYFKLPDITLYSRVKFQKHKLESQLENYIDSKSEIENMIDNGYLRIFDCGNTIYIDDRNQI